MLPRPSAAAPLVPVGDLVNVLEFESQAQQVLSAAVFARISGGDRSAFDRSTLRPRVMLPTTDLDLGQELFGQPLYAPIVVGPVADHRGFHADGELETVRGATAAKTPVVVTSRSTAPMASLVAAAGATSVWFQVFATDEDVRTRVRDAIDAGCRVVCVTVGTTWASGAPRATARTNSRDWDVLRTLRREVTTPLIVKGIVSADTARVALEHGADGLVVSNYGGLAGGAREASLLALPGVVAAVNGRVPVLVDGGFRRGTDVLKALALGARAVLVARPVMWGLAAYGAAGVTAVLDMLQFELARYMCMTGASRLDALESSMVRMHRA